MNTKTTTNQDETSILFNTIEDLSETIHNSLNFENVSLQDWFSAFTQTETYQALSEKERQKTFNQYEDMKYILKVMDEFCEKSKIGVYRNS
ncbi:MAG: hypothetical protein K0M56_00975 [Kaistella sp.]|nr:hypothetical protein [Kaistella sp.]